MKATFRLQSGDLRWSAGQFLAVVEQAEQWLQSMHLTPGDRVGLWGANSPLWVVLCAACWRSRLIVVPINSRLTDSEVDAQAITGEVKLLIQVRGDTALPSHSRDLVTRSPFALPRAVEATREDQAIELANAGPAAALFTSGTTAAPRLISLSHENFRASVAASRQNLGPTDEEAWLGTLPLFHVGGLALLYRCLVEGLTLVLEEKFEATRVAELIAAGQITHASLVPTMLKRLLEVLPDASTTSLKAILVGGGPVAPELMQRARAKRLPVMQTYGLTEACSQVCTEAPQQADGLTAGRPLSGLQVRVLDALGLPAGVGEIGQIEIAGPTLSAALGPRYLTGDLGSLDAQGRLTIFSRRVDLIVSGGENISPAEIEAVLEESTDVQEVAVVPAVDAEWGQVPVAFVAWRGEPRAAELLAMARERLAVFKVPKRVITVTSLPRTAAGKLLRRLLVERAQNVA